MMTQLLNAVLAYISACWDMLVEMAPYMLFGFFVAGLLHILVNPQTIATYLGKGRIRSVLYATLLGVPLPLCSCGVLPTATALRKQGANDGATMAFLIATPETGVDSIAVTYGLLDPIMAVFRPLAAFVTAFAAGVTQNLFGKSYNEQALESIRLDRSCKVDHCCDGENCPPETHRNHHSYAEKFAAAVKYGFGEILDDIAGWLVVGLLIAGAISVLIPETFFEAYLGGGFSSMLIMLAVGIPLYICATGSTPIAAALIMKGVSPGAAFVFLLAGPATNAATISVVYGLLGKRATTIYLSSIAACSILMGLLLDQIYGWLNLAAQSTVGSAGDMIPRWFSVVAALGLLLLIGRSFYGTWQRRRAHPAETCGSRCSCSHSHSS